MNRRICSLVLSLILTINIFGTALVSAEGVQGDEMMTARSDTSRISLGQMTRYQTDGSRVTFTAQNGKMRVSFLEDDMVRVRMAKAGENFAAEDTYSQAIDKQEDEYNSVSVRVTESAGRVTMKAASLTVVVDTATMALAFYDKNGDLLTRNSDEGMSYDRNGAGKTVSFERDVAGKEEHFFGLGSGGEGEAGKTLDWRDKTYDLWLSDSNIHAITPLYYSTAGYAVYLHSAYRGKMSFLAEPYELHVDGGELDYYFFAGDSMKAMLGDFTELSGYMNMPPKYALGLTLRGCGQWGDTQLVDFLKRFYDAGIPVDTLGVEPGWQTATYPCTYVWSNKFPNPKSFIDTIHSMGARVNLWEHPYVSPQSPIAESIRPYSIDGSQYSRSDWADGGMKYGFGGLIPDFTQPEAFDIYWSIHKQNLLSVGVDGYKIDETDGWSAPDDASVKWPSGIQANEYHNLLGTLTTNLTHEKYKEEYNQRTFIFSRGNYTGMQRYATSSYTDYYGFRQFLCSVLAQSFSGTYFTPEIRSTSSTNTVDYMRRMQMMLLTPFAMFNEWVDGDCVLNRSQMVIDNAKKYVGLHYALIPYTYSNFWEQHNTGVTVVRPLVMEFWKDENTYGINDQYMLGSALMAAPISSTSMYATRNIYLPAGCQWMDYETGYVYEGGQTISYKAHCSVLPLFVRVGSIIPMAGKGNNTQDTTDPTLYLDVYPAEQETSFTLFEDDGISYDYEQGAYCTTEITALRSSGMLTASVKERQTPAGAKKTYRPASRNIVMQLHYRSEPTEVKLGGTSLTRVTESAFDTASSNVWTYSAEKQVIYVKLYDTGKTQTVTAAVSDEGAQPDAPPTEELKDYVTYECEDGSVSVLSGDAVAKPVDSVSGGKVVGNMGGPNDGRMVMTVTVPEDGLYPVNVNYVSGDDRFCMLKVNDGAAMNVRFAASGGWTSVAFLTLTLELKAGENTLTFYTEDDSYGPDFDCVSVSKTWVEPDPIPEGTRYEAEDYMDVSTVGVQANAFASGEKTASGFAGGNRYLNVLLDLTEKTAPYQVTITYANPDADIATVKYKVNGVLQQNVLSLEPTASPHIFANFTFTAYLSEGYNDLIFYLEDTPGSGLEIDYITVADPDPDEKIAEKAGEIKELVDAIGTVKGDNCAEKKELIEQAEAAYEAMKSTYGQSKTDAALGNTLARLQRARTLYDFYTSDRVYGDVDGHAGVDAGDALKVLQHSVKLVELTGKEAEMADVNLDEQINAVDALCILQFSVALIPLLPVH